MVMDVIWCLRCIYIIGGRVIYLFFEQGCDE